MSRIVSIICILIFAPHLGAAEQAPPDALPWEDARRFAEALQTIRNGYVEPVADSALINYAIRGMAEGVDPYSTYLAPEEYDQARIEALGRYEGIGVEVAPVERGYVVVAPFDKGPAQRAGLRAGDRLLSIDGEPLENADPARLDQLIQGPTGTTVTLTVQRGAAPPFDVTLTRELIKIPSISGERLGDGALFVRIAHFSETSAQDLIALLHEFDVAHGLVLDLRNNGGGIVDGAVAIADLFLEQGVILTTRGRAPGQDMEYAATPNGLSKNMPAGISTDVPIVVLVNAGTASAAEILAGALQDHARATLLGTTTFGKGAVQSLIPLEGGGALKLTTAHYRTPSGRVIHEAGIVPDIEMPAADTQPPGEPRQDEIVQRALALLKNPPTGSRE